MKKIDNVKKVVMEKVWHMCREASKKFGGSPKDYLSEAMKQIWKEVKDGLKVVIYRKKEDNYENVHTQLVTNIKQKYNKQGDLYYTSISIEKGFRSFKDVIAIVDVSIKDVEDIEERYLR